MFELPFFAIGIKFPKQVNQSEGNFYQDLKALRDSQYVKSRPIVVFPEGTKTNGRGILNFEEDIIQILVQAATDKLRIHTIRFDYQFEYVSPYNTTDVYGLFHLAKMLT